MDEARRRLRTSVPVQSRLHDATTRTSRDLLTRPPRSAPPPRRRPGDVTGAPCRCFRTALASRDASSLAALAPGRDRQAGAARRSAGGLGRPRVRPDRDRGTEWVRQADRDARIRQMAALITGQRCEPTDPSSPGTQRATWRRSDRVEVRDCSSPMVPAWSAQRERSLSAGVLRALARGSQLYFHKHIWRLR